jgi:hypothetical protein
MKRSWTEGAFPPPTCPQNFVRSLGSGLLGHASTSSHPIATPRSASTPEAPLGLAEPVSAATPRMMAPPME